ncbi:uncharacterized protein PHACADRAFT_262770 [Phanerochaete carnosa HHB-10118-sp]|uniref:Uncharacterized protein n=1 Tax=Phanerochaete carnosa (strain HHB-10118-sp) TaxID=650164 RepID=K5WKW1_PHACS|nr:uncharacterized protein PHACADRAFT_262770 [Phanerochaete carnosa HHB-10118-sp]EKM50892.1 hypothetical protein PHACADRAFT_262770 [Phanerochaete carnosa HHB-10118-sp]
MGSRAVAKPLESVLPGSCLRRLSSAFSSVPSSAASFAQTAHCVPSASTSSTTFLTADALSSPLSWSRACWSSLAWRPTRVAQYSRKSHRAA